MSIVYHSPSSDHNNEESTQISELVHTESEHINSQPIEHNNTDVQAPIKTPVILNIPLNSQSKPNASIFDSITKETKHSNQNDQKISNNYKNAIERASASDGVASSTATHQSLKSAFSNVGNRPKESIASAPLEPNHANVSQTQLPNVHGVPAHESILENSQSQLPLAAPADTGIKDQAEKSTGQQIVSNTEAETSHSSGTEDYVPSSPVVASPKPNRSAVANQSIQNSKTLPPPGVRYGLNFHEDSLQFKTTQEHERHLAPALDTPVPPEAEQVAEETPETNQIAPSENLTTQCDSENANLHVKQETVADSHPQDVQKASKKNALAPRLPHVKGTKKGSTTDSLQSGPSVKLESDTAGSKPPETDPPEVKKGKTSAYEYGTSKDLLWDSLYLLFLIVLVLWGLNSLLTWKHDLDVQPRISYKQLSWSNGSDSLAFLRQEERQLSKGEKVNNTLWLSDRFGENVKCLKDDVPSEYSLLGWFKKDSYLVLRTEDPKLNLTVPKPDKSEKKQEEDNKEQEAQKKKTEQNNEIKVKKLTKDELSDNLNGLMLMEIGMSDNGSLPTSYVNISGKNLQIAGHDKNEIFLVQYLLDKDHGRGQLNLFSYQPGKAAVQLLVAIPSRHDEIMHVDQVVSSPNEAKLAIVISFFNHGKKTGGADTPLGVWLFNRQDKSLSWTTISASSARDLRVVWSKDSEWLGGVARFADKAELFALYGPNNCQAAKLHGISQNGEIVPLIMDMAHELTFVSANRIDKYNFEKQANKPLLSASNLKVNPYNFAVAESGAVAYAANTYNAPNIYICTLNNANCSIVNLPIDKAKHGKLYRFAGYIQYSLNYWTKFIK
ncbi:MAG: hypothetical protein K6A35_03155 [bacterium]|nr:hypothetical protein [bacterium]